jgi:putative ABC transport system permease protein
MLRNYLKTALRSIRRHKANALINITGLAAGIASCMLIYMFVHHELSFDRFNSRHEQLYRLVFDYKFPDKLDHLAVAAPVAGNTLRREFPEVKNSTSLSPYSSKLLVRMGDKKFYEEDVYIADSTFFNVFDYRLLRGDKNTVLNEPNAVVINQSMAEKYFGAQNPVGKVLEYDNNDGTFASYKVTGVFEDVPASSHLKFTSLVSYKTLEVLYGTQGGLNSWHNAGSFVYLQLKEGADAKAFEKKIEHLYDKYASQYKNVKASISMHLEPLTDIHLHSDRLFDAAIKGNSSYVYIFSAIALFLLLIACINYINLATAQGKLRMKEIGVRTVIGAGRPRLIVQFIVESAVVILFSVLLSQLLVLLFLPAFNYLTSLQLAITDIYTWRNCFFLAALAISIVILAGIYPAFYLTAINPSLALKNNGGAGEKGVTLRKVLVTAQFTISMVLISATLIVRSQVNYMLEHDPGFNKSNVMAIRFQDTVAGYNYKAIKAELLKLKSVVLVSQTSTLPGDAADRKITRVESAVSGVINEIPLEPIWVDWDYFDLMQIRLHKGRWFERSHALDPRESFVVNESAVKTFGWKEGIGKKVIWGNGPRARDGKVIGVVKDIYTGSLKQQVDPILFICDENPSRVYSLGHLLVRIQGNDKEKAISDVCATWSKFDPVHPVDYKFIEENVANIYNREQRTNVLFHFLSLLTIFIACLGLFGLISFSVSQRVKEIGIRKVLGASVAGITQLLSIDFLKLVLLAFVFAVPIAWYMMHQWLRDFAFHISIPWWIFLVAGAAAFVIAMVTISVQSIKAAMANPVKSLRME